MSGEGTASSAVQSAAAITLSVVIPTYREAKNLELLIPKISDVLRAAAVAHEIIVVDDNSQDGTAAIVDALQRAGHTVRLVTRVGERGLSSAVIRGFVEARGAYLLCMDADMSHPPDALPRMLEAVRTPGTDFVIGSRYVSGATTEEGWGLFRWLNSRVATLLARPFTAAKDPLAGYFALPRAVFARARELSPIGYKIGLELLVKCDCRQVREIPIHFSKRKLGQSKLTLREQIRYLSHLKRLAGYKYDARSRLANQTRGRDPAN
jgi:dolichol-phosphate mannosyltransferase